MFRLVLPVSGSALIAKARAAFKNIVIDKIVMLADPIVDRNIMAGIQWAAYRHEPNRGTVVGASSHSTFDVSGVQTSFASDTVLSINCTDNSVAWKTMIVMARLGDEHAVLAVASDDNGTFRNVSELRLPISLAGVYDDFGATDISSLASQVGQNTSDISDLENAVDALEDATKVYAVKYVVEEEDDPDSDDPEDTIDVPYVKYCKSGAVGWSSPVAATSGSLTFDDITLTFDASAHLASLTFDADSYENKLISVSMAIPQGSPRAYVSLVSQVICGSTDVSLSLGSPVALADGDILSLSISVSDFELPEEQG